MRCLTRLCNGERRRAFIMGLTALARYSGGSAPSAGGHSFMLTSRALPRLRRPSSGPGFYVDLRDEGSMDRALLGDLQELRSLLVAQRPGQLHVQLDPVDPPFFGLALGTVGSVYSRVPEPGRHALQRPALASGVHPDGYRRARAQSREQQVVGRGSLVVSAHALWFVGQYLVWTDGDLLGKPFGVSMDHHLPRCPCLLTLAGILGSFAHRNPRSVESNTPPRVPNSTLV